MNDEEASVLADVALEMGRPDLAARVFPRELDRLIHVVKVATALWIVRDFTRREFRLVQFPPVGLIERMEGDLVVTRPMGFTGSPPLVDDPTYRVYGREVEDDGEDPWDEFRRVRVTHRE